MKLTSIECHTKRDISISATSMKLNLSKYFKLY